MHRARAPAFLGLMVFPFGLHSGRVQHESFCDFRSLLILLPRLRTWHETCSRGPLWSSVLSHCFSHSPVFYQPEIKDVEGDGDGQISGVWSAITDVLSGVQGHLAFFLNIFIVA